MAVGGSDDYVESRAGRVEVFEIADDEQLIGCKIDRSDLSWLGVTWFKIKMI